MIIKNIESKIRLATFVATGSLVAAVAICAAVAYFSYRQAADARRSIYVLDANQVPLMARQTDVQLNRPAEYRAHIHLYHTLFFTMMPDEKFIEYQMRQAMYLVDESGALQYNSLKEKGFFNSVLASSAVLTVQTDSIVLDVPRKQFRYYGRQRIERRSSVITRTLVTEGHLQDLDIRSDNNPHAVMITRWKTLENKDISNVPKSTL